MPDELDERAQSGGLDYIAGSPLPMREYGSDIPAAGQSPLLPGAEPVSEATKELIDSEVRRIVEDELDEVRQLLTDNRERLDALAEALLERETLDELDAYAAAGIAREREPASA